MIVSSKGLEMCSNKVQTIKDWPIPKNIKEVQSFLGFANFYHQFIKNYSNIAVPLMALICKDIQFEWTFHANNAFNHLHVLFCQAPILLLPNFQRPFIIETDASDTATRCNSFSTWR